MTDNTGKGFKVPKIRKEYKDGLREVDITSRDAKEINHILQRSYIESGYKPVWDLKTVHYVQNRELEERYRGKRAEMKDEGRSARDLGEQYSFLLFRDKSIVTSVAKSGLKCRSLPFNALGESKFGLYLCRNADIQLRLSESWDLDTCVMVVFKITAGKCKVLLSGSDGGEGMEPTPNFDCHVAQYQPRSCDPIHLQLARSQIYLYEYTEDCEPSDSPRHCLPYAVLTYHKGQNKSQTVQPQSHSYSVSKRQALVADRLRTESSDSDSQSKGESVSMSDPRQRRKESTRAQSTRESLNPKDPRLAYIQGDDSGLCVPRLTPGPPPMSAPVPPPWVRDSRMQQFNALYQPSFGPQFECSGPGFPPQQFQPVPGQSAFVHQANQHPQTIPPNENRSDKPNQIPDPRRRDPRIQKAGGDTKKAATKRLSLSDYKQKVGIQPVPRPEKGQEEASQEDEEEEEEMYDPSNPSMDYDVPRIAQVNTDTLNTSSTSEDAVDNPDDMAKALNDLSDPEDVSESPHRIADEVEDEDPLLAAAMRKLVEHSGDVSLFTEALRKLQEKAEEMGDALHDPAFLVKAIAENVESLTKSKGTEENTEIPEKTMISENVTFNMSERLLGQTTSHSINKASQAEDSPLSKAMKNTLEELNKSSQLPTPPSGGVLSNTTHTRKDVDLASIPMPLDMHPPPETNKMMSGSENVQVTLDNIALPDRKHDVVEEKEQKPAEILKKTNKPIPPISFSLKKINSVGISDSIKDFEDKEEAEEPQDKDERTNVKSFIATHKEHVSFQRKDPREVLHVTRMEQDRDYRIQEKDRYLGFSIGIPPSHREPFELSEDGMSAPKDSRTKLVADKDERRQSPQTILMDKDERLNRVIPEQHTELLDERHVKQEPYKEILDNQLNRVKQEPYTELLDERPNSVKQEPYTELQDRDDRQNPSVTNLSDVSKGQNNMKGSLDMFDTDDRVLQSDSQTFPDPSLLDKDDRRSHSRSQSPKTISPVFMDKDERMVGNPEIEEPVESRRDEDRIRSRSASPTLESDSTEVKIIPLHNLDDSQSSEESGLFDAYSLGSDKPKETKTTQISEDAGDHHKGNQAENEFGDVDWRLAAEAAEMGDVDLRATSRPKPSQGETAVSVQSSASDMIAPPPSSDNIVMSQHATSYMNTEYRPYQDTSNMQPMLPPPPGAIRPAGIYTTNRPNLEAYTTYKGPIPAYSTSSGFSGEYKPGGYQGRSYGDQYSYSTGGGRNDDSYWTGGNGPRMEQFPSYSSNPYQPGPLPPPPPGGLHNVINNLDFSNLKNILATVQIPGISPGIPPNISPNKQQDNVMPPVEHQRAQPEQFKTDSDEERENQPAFCTGLSFLKSKQPKIDFSRPKYSGLARVGDAQGPPDGPHERKLSTGDPQEPVTGRVEFHRNHSDGGETTLPGFDAPGRGEEASAGLFTGFGSTPSGGIPGLGLLDKPDPDSLGKPFTFSEDIPDRDIKSQWFEEPTGKDIKKTDKSESKNDKSSSKSKSPRKKSKRNRTGSSESQYAESWQNAILESMEESALAVKNDDSFSNEPDTPTMDPDTPTIEQGSESVVGEGVRVDDGKRELDEKDTETDSKRLKTDPDDSDDEDDGLVIDLDTSQTSKPESEKPEAAVGNVITIDDDEDENRLEIVENETDADGRDTPVQDEKQEEASCDEKGKGLNVLEEDTVTVPTTKNELKTFIEKKRKNIVIKLKGETKIVNPKTGKAYNENVVGSAIEVLGQPKKGTSNIGLQQIHPIHGIVSLGNRPSAASSNYQGSSISTLINRNPVPKPGIQNNPPPSGHLILQSQSMNAYIHPYTGQKMGYPVQPSPQTGPGFHSNSQTAPPYGRSIPTLGPAQTLQIPDNTQQPSRGDGKNYEFSKTNAIKYIKTEPDSTRKRIMTDSREVQSGMKKSKIETTSSVGNPVVKVLTDHSDNPNKPSTSGTNNDDDSELEDGEISDDDEDDEIDIIPRPGYHDDRDQGHWSRPRSHDRRNVPPYDHPDYSRNYPRSMPPPDDRSHRPGSQWSDRLPRHDYKPSLKSEEANLLSKSAETFSKAKQKLQARNQVKTLGDWLKVELEIDNIEPLQKVIPYSLNTDLTTIPKQRRRKIRFKVKNTIEQEGIKQSKFNTSPPEPDRETRDEDTPHKPEVSRDQIERELHMVRDLMGALKAPISLRMKSPIVFRGNPLMPGSFDEISFKAALTHVESEMISLLGRSNFHGYPHRRVPKDLLLESEYNGFRSSLGDTFLMLMTPISMKAQARLAQFKIDLKKVHDKKERAKNPEVVKKLDQEIQNLSNQRQNLLKSFTGYLNKKRIVKLEDHADKFTMVLDFFRSQDFLPSALKFIRTTQMDIRQHLMIAKQYFVMEEEKTGVPSIQSMEVT